MSNFYQGMQQQLPIQNSYYPDQHPVVKTPSNPIGDEGVRTLMSANNKMKFNITQKDVWEMLCYHTHNGQFLVDPVDSSRQIWKCRICGEIIDMGADISDKDLETAIQLLTIAWQQAKICNYGAVSADIMFDNAQSLAVIKQFPNLFKFIMANFRQNKIQSQQTQSKFQNVGGATYNAIHSTGGFGYNPVYNYGAPTMMQSQAIGNPFQPTIQQPVMYAQPQPQYQQGIVQPQYVAQQPPIELQPQYQPTQQQITYSYEQQPQQQYQPMPSQQPPMPQNVPPPAATGTVVPEQPTNQQPPPVAYPPKGQQPAGQNDSMKRALGFNL